MVARFFFLFALLISVLSLHNCKAVDVDKTGSSPSQSDTTAYSCAGKTTCPEMKSCDEAKFYLDNCPGAKIDGDGDGIPCEDQWCRH